MAIQALHTNDISEVTVPLGININPNEAVEFSILDSTLPDTINVYLEDTETGTNTLLNDENYTVNLDNAVVGKGRFYLRFVNQTLSTNENTLEQLQIFTNQQERSLIIKGQLQNAAQFKLYDLQGRLVKEIELSDRTTIQSIDISELPSGVFIADIQNENARKTQKIILK